MTPRGGIIDKCGNEWIARGTPQIVSGGKFNQYCYSGVTDVNYHTDKPINFDIGTGDYTVEFWANFYQNGHTDCVLEISAEIGGMTSNYPNYIILGGMYQSYAGNQQIVYCPTNEWVHYALVRNNGVVKYYQNGKEKFSVSSNYDVSNFKYMCIGNAYYHSQNIRGLIDSIRVANHAIYTREFTPKRFVDYKLLYVAEDKKVYEMR
nr:MAG TPA: Concanavalin A-like lectin/glucanase superfamily protein [Caudoviricetes sp.]